MKRPNIKEVSSTAKSFLNPNKISDSLSEGVGKAGEMLSSSFKNVKDHISSYIPKGFR